MVPQPDTTDLILGVGTLVASGEAYDIWTMDTLPPGSSLISPT